MQGGWGGGGGGLRESCSYVDKVSALLPSIKQCRHQWTAGWVGDHRSFLCHASNLSPAEQEQVA